MKEIVIAQPLGISRETLDTLSASLVKDGYHITAYDSLPKDQKDLGNRLEKADLAVIANYPLKKEALAKAPSLKYLCVAFTGVDHVDIDYCREKGIAVSNCAGYSMESVAELTFGIIGTGAIGARVAELAKAFGAHVIGYNRSHKLEGMEYTDLDTLLKTADIVSVHLPLTPETRHILDAEKFSLMKKSAILINTARGGVIDNKALADCLRNGTIAGAGIDVFDGEPPLPKDYPLLQAPNLVLTPHVGFDTEEAMDRRAVIVFDNLESYLAGNQKNTIC
ncbi:NAD(P)-dependent oxidoreductase [uncultured Dialister sp.]|uniref:NAD(P)-dependent oxidoreductase n=1 Tax=uncultured Dialister sp. TaxID=278064 RepID=UPI002601832B|nr:NAD(P)-dependent oxidoreductase [uncultured Dialister sp.]